MADWANHARMFLALREDSLLSEGISCIESSMTAKSRDTEVLRDLRTLFQAFADTQFQVVPTLAKRLEGEFRNSGRREWELTIRLMGLEVGLQMVANHDYYPPEQQSAVIEFGIQLCSEALSISRELGDRACEAFYLHFLAADAQDRQNLPAAARRLYEEAVVLYQGLTKHRNARISVETSGSV